MAERTVIRGRLVDAQRSAGIEGSRIDVVERASGRVVATAWTDADGAFEAALRERAEAPLRGPARSPLQPAAPESRYELRVSPELTGASTAWTARGSGLLEAAVSAHRARAFPPIKAATLAELRQHEAEILARLQRVANGGQLFLIHPFLALADVGVDLGAKARQEILGLEPRLGALSALPYQALKASRARQSFRVRVHGLFRRVP